MNNGKLKKIRVFAVAPPDVHQELDCLEFLIHQLNKPGEIADRIANLAANPDKLQQLRDANTSTFEEHFTPNAVTRQLMGYLERALPMTPKTTEK